MSGLEPLWRDGRFAPVLMPAPNVEHPEAAAGRRMDALALANELDAAWHDQPRLFEREAITRFWGLLTLPARVLDPLRPREMLRSTTVLRNARFKGDPVKGMFFANKDFTEVDGLFPRSSAR